MQLAKETSESQKKINLIYAANGFGKTTLLRFIYNFLAPSGAGYKSWISRLPFKQATLTFSDKSFFQIIKTNGLKGSYSVEHVSSSGENTFFRILADHEFKVIDTIPDTDIDSLQKFLYSFDHELFYITDRREYLTTSRIGDVFRQFPTRSSRREIIDEDGRKRAIRDQDADNLISIRTLSSMIRDRFQRQIIESGLYAQRSSNSIYLDLARLISSPQISNLSRSREELYTQVDEIRRDAGSSRGFGTIPDINFDDYLDLIKQTPDSTIPQVSLVLSPFLESTMARVQAAKTHITRMSLFLEELNRFYSDKLFSFDVQHGLTIKQAENGAPVELEWLSSGERQLFTILGSVFLVQDRTSFVLIDEPEISLNILWQREFVGALKRIAADAPIQYILASHSLEMLSHQDAHVTPIGQ